MSFLGVCCLEVFRRFRVRGSAVTTVTATVSPSKVKVVEVDKSSTLSMVSEVCGDGGGGGGVDTYRSRAVRCKFVCSNSRGVSRIVILLVGTPGACAERSAIRVSYRNNICIVGEILRTMVGGKTEPTRPKRFAGETFLGNEVSLSRTRSIVSMVGSGGSFTLGDSLDRLNKTILKDVERVERRLLRRVTFVRSTLSSPRRVSLSNCPRGLHTVISGRCIRVSNLLGASSGKEVLGRKVGAMVVKGPGTKGSSLLGILIKASETVIASVTKAAESILRRRVGVNKVALGLISATNVEDARSIIRGVNIGGTVRRTGRTSLVVCIISSSITLSSGSCSVVGFVGSGGTIVLLGGSSLTSGISTSSVGGLISGGIVSISTGRDLKVSRLSSAVGSVFFSKRISFGSRVCVAGVERGGLLSSTGRDLGLIVGDVSSSVPRSFCSVSLVDTCRSLKLVVKRSIRSSLVSRVFDGFYVKG